MEEWLPVFDGYYEVSSHGNVRRLKPGPSTRAGQPIRLATNDDGYLYFTAALGKRGRTKFARVHMAVAEVFIGPRPERMVVNHKDGMKTNNRADNLEYTTYRGNVRHAQKLGLRAIGEKHGQHKLTEVQVIEIKSLLDAEVLTISEIARKFGVTHKAVRLIEDGSNWSHVRNSQPALVERIAEYVEGMYWLDGQQSRIADAIRERFAPPLERAVLAGRLTAP